MTAELQVQLHYASLLEAARSAELYEDIDNMVPKWVKPLATPRHSPDIVTWLADLHASGSEELKLREPLPWLEAADGWTNATLVVGRGATAELLRVRGIDASGTILQIGNPTVHDHIASPQTPQTPQTPQLPRTGPSTHRGTGSGSCRCREQRSTSQVPSPLTSPGRRPVGPARHRPATALEVPPPSVSSSLRGLSPRSPTDTSWRPLVSPRSGGKALARHHCGWDGMPPRELLVGGHAASAPECSNTPLSLPASPTRTEPGDGQACAAVPSAGVPWSAPDRMAAASVPSCGDAWTKAARSAKIREAGQRHVRLQQTPEFPRRDEPLGFYALEAFALRALGAKLARPAGSEAPFEPREGGPRTSDAICDAVQRHLKRNVSSRGGAQLAEQLERRVADSAAKSSNTPRQLLSQPPLPIGASFRRRHIK